MKHQQNVYGSIEKNIRQEDNAKITVYYDGHCKVCNSEINHYKSQKGAENINFIDICSVHFDAVKENLDPQQIHKVMHVRRTDGSIATRVDAFVEIWNMLPKYSLLARIAKNSLVNYCLEIGYSGFAAIRPLLPRYTKIHECENSPYCEVKSGSGLSKIKMRSL